MAQRFEGKNLEEALEAASQALNAERYRLKYKVLTEKRGFLGGVKKLAIEVELDPTATPPAREEEREHAVDTTVAVREELPRERPRGRRQRPGRGREETATRRDRQPGRVELVEVETPLQEERSAAATQVANWFVEFSSRAGFELDIRTEEDPAQIEVRFFGRDAKRFVANESELLDAVQVIASKGFIGIDKIVVVDAYDVKRRRREELARQARESAERVQESGKSQLLPPMGAGDRRIVHMTLADHPSVVTESMGEGEFKRVSVQLRGERQPGS